MQTIIMKVLSEILILTVLILIVHGTLGPDDKKKKTKATKKSAEKIQLPDLSVEKRNLIKKQIDSMKDIIKNHDKYCLPCSKSENSMENSGDVLGYVTPWNSKGYDISKTFAKKLNYISPVWLQIKRAGRNKYELTGTHDIDVSWMTNVRNASSNLLFVPRILFEKLKAEDLHALFNNEEEISRQC
jgi:chitinase domain-containing protein 1